MLAKPAREKPLPRLIKLVVAWADQLSILFTLVGLVGLLLLPLVDRQAKFDEKSLLVGGATPTFQRGMSLPHGMRLAKAAHAYHHMDSPNTSLAQLVAKHMKEAGMEVHVTHMCAPGPLLGHMGEERPQCTHVHGVLRSAHSDGTEALLLVTPVTLTQGVVEGLSPYWDAPAEGSLLLLGGFQALMHHLSQVTWLARDVVWVLPDARCGAAASLQHWADVNFDEVQAGEGGGGARGGVGGVVQQALVLQADRVEVTSAQVLVEGFDGQLPKLDTYLVLKELLYVLRGVTLRPTQGNELISSLAKATQASHPVLSQHLSRLSALIAFAWRQAQGLPSGPHAALKRHMVDAATTRLSATDHSGRPLPPPPDPQPRTPTPPLPAQLEAKAASLAQYAELVLRSLNNLDERFHHSFFLYLLTEVQRFVAVEMYIVPLVACIVVLVLKAAKQRHLLRPPPPPAPTPPSPSATAHDQAMAAPVTQEATRETPRAPGAAQAAPGAAQAAPDAAQAAPGAAQAAVRAAPDGDPNPKAGTPLSRESPPSSLDHSATGGVAHMRMASGSTGQFGTPGSTVCQFPAIAGSPAVRVQPTDDASGLWPRAIAIAVNGVLVSFITGVLLRALLCPSCQLCQYPQGSTCCAAAAGAYGGYGAHNGYGGYGQAGPGKGQCAASYSQTGAVEDVGTQRNGPTDTVGMGSGQCAAGYTQPGAGGFTAPGLTAGKLLGTWVRLLPFEMQQHVMQLGRLEAGALVGSLVVVAVTLGWQALLLICQPSGEGSAPGSAEPTEKYAQGKTSRYSRLQRQQVLAVLSGSDKAETSSRGLLAAVRVVVLTISAVLLTAMASMNWALAYCVAAALASILTVSLTKPLRRPDLLAFPQSSNAQSNGLPVRRNGTVMARVVAGLHVLLRVAVLTTTSPVALAWIASGTPLPSMTGSFERANKGFFHVPGVASVSGSAGVMGLLGEPWKSVIQGSGRLVSAMVCCSWINTYLFLWAAYVPCWAFEVVWLWRS